MPTVYNDCLAKMPILDDGRAILELEAVSESLKTLLSANPLVVADAGPEIQGAVQKVIAENESVRLLLAQHGLNYELLRVSVRDILLNQDKKVYCSTYMKSIAIGDDTARQDFYYQCLSHMEQRECRVLGNAWVRLLEPKGQTRRRYKGSRKAVPPWWPSGPDKIRYRCPNLMNKRGPELTAFTELIILLIYFMGVVVTQDPNGRAASLSLDVAKLEEATCEAMAPWYAEKRGFLTQLFRVLYMEERYRRGKLGASATVYVDPIDPKITVTNNGELSQNRGDILDDFYCQQPNQPSTRENELPLNPEEYLEGGNIEQANLTTHSLSQLLVREAESCEYKDDETGLFPWKISLWSPVVVVGGRKYYRQVVLILESDIHDYNTQIYDEPETSVDGFDYWGEGLYSKKGKWYGIDKDEVRSLTVIGEDQVWDGNDGQKYRKSISGLNGLFVGLTRQVVVIDNVRHVAHLVLRISLSRRKQRREAKHEALTGM
ncbi:hypothetical protein V500_02150 [Pseudogymnoascus sp. VKM F-4518 (FW-2643)]|nr:hypothetical protein V500_02150 [Pseudogymnoascus sp. VKM F-4518 (FW-2643)]